MEAMKRCPKSLLKMGLKLLSYKKAFHNLHTKHVVECFAYKNVQLCLNSSVCAPCGSEEEETFTLSELSIAAALALTSEISQ